MLFADVVASSKIMEEQVPNFVEHFMGAINKLVAESPDKPLMKNTWGDALYSVFASVQDGGNFALQLRDLVCDTDWQAKGLPKETQSAHLPARRAGLLLQRAGSSRSWNTPAPTLCGRPALNPSPRRDRCTPASNLRPWRPPSGCKASPVSTWDGSRCRNMPASFPCTWSAARTRDARQLETPGKARGVPIHYLSCSKIKPIRRCIIHPPE